MTMFAVFVACDSNDEQVNNNYPNTPLNYEYPADNDNGCDGNESNDTPSDQYPSENDDSSSINDNDTQGSDEVHNNDCPNTNVPDIPPPARDVLCYFCNEYCCDPLTSLPSIPHFITERATDELMQSFDYVYQFELNQAPDLNFLNNIVFWSEEVIRDLQFVSFYNLDFIWSENYGYLHVFYWDNVLFSIDELLVGEAFQLNVMFTHYLIPRGGLVFTDEAGEQHRMMIQESMRGGCWPLFNLVPAQG